MNLQAFHEAQVLELISDSERSGEYTHISEALRRCQRRNAYHRLKGYPKRNIPIKKVARMKQGERMEKVAFENIIRWSKSPICADIFPGGLRIAEVMHGKKKVPMLDMHVDEKRNPCFIHDKKLHYGGRIDIAFTHGNGNEIIPGEHKLVASSYFGELLDTFSKGQSMFDSFFESRSYKGARTWPSQGIGYGEEMRLRFGRERVKRILFAISADVGLTLCELIDLDSYSHVWVAIQDAVSKVNDVVSGDKPIESLYMTSNLDDCIDCPFYHDPCESFFELQTNGVLDMTGNERLEYLVSRYKELKEGKAELDGINDEIKDMLRDEIDNSEVKPGFTNKKLVVCHGAEIVLEMRWHNESTPKPKPAGHSYYCKINDPEKIKPQKVKEA